MELNEIKEVIEMMKENDLTEFSMERDGLRIRIKRGPEGFQQTVIAPSSQAPASVVNPPPQVAPVTTTTPAEPEPENGTCIVSPMVGTFYRAASPDTPPFAEVGQAVDEDTVVCIIEAMKVMNEIKAEMKGVITEVLAENAKPVEFGQKLFAVRPK